MQLMMSPSPSPELLCRCEHNSPGVSGGVHVGAKGNQNVTGYVWLANQRLAQSQNFSFEATPVGTRRRSKSLVTLSQKAPQNRILKTCVIETFET
jgi:hypothetical protein